WTQVPYSVPAVPGNFGALWQPAAAHPPTPWSCNDGCAGLGAGIGSGGWAWEWTAQAARPATTVTIGTNARRLTGTPPPAGVIRQVCDPRRRPSTIWLGERAGKAGIGSDGTTCPRKT